MGEYVGDEDRNDIHSENFDEDSQLVYGIPEDQWVDLEYALANLVTDLTDSPYFSIDGYWKNNKEKFEGYIISKYDKFIKLGFEEDDIFFYGIDPVNYDDSEEFIITTFNRIGVKPFPKLYKMARYILDIASKGAKLKKHEINIILDWFYDLADKRDEKEEKQVVSLRSLIDNTNENQFHDGDERFKNRLSEKQINKYNEKCK